MNLWECQHPGCKCTAVGSGGAIGLLAIGWYFVPGPKILCPAHHPAGYPAAMDQANNYNRAIADKTI